MITTQIVYDHRGRTKPGAEGPLEVRVIIDRKAYYINTGIKVRKNEYKAGIVVNRVDCDVLQKRLDLIYRRIDEIINRDMEAGRKIDVAYIRRRAWEFADSQSGTPFLDWFEDQIPTLPLKEGTAKHYWTTARKLREFGSFSHWDDLTVENICQFDSWLRQQTKPQSDGDKKAKVKPEPIGVSTVWNYHKILKAMLYRAVLFDRIPSNPYEKLRGQFKKGERERIDYLTDEEMQAFVSLKPVRGSKMAMARDLFVFQMYTGFSYSDTQSFNIKDYKLIDGRWINTGERIKTGVPYTSQLLPPIVDILERYGWQVPKLDNSDYNLCLKALGMACGIERPLHSHMARHTFATFMLRHGVPIEHVSKMLGHTNITQTQRYAKIVAKDIHDDFEKIAKAMET